MKLTEFFLQQQNWSLALAAAMIVLYSFYSFILKPKLGKALSMASAMILIYLVLGSPLNSMLHFGLHSVFMIQQIIMLMVVPVFLWNALPEKVHFSFLKNTRNSYLVAWFIGVTAMWAGHFISAWKMASETGISICGITASSHSWVSYIPTSFLLMVMLLAGMVFVQPVFHPNTSRRITNPLNRVAYLFTSCVSCSLLGLWVVFTAVFAPDNNVFVELIRMGSPVSLSLKTDQELAGMIMWVPGCVFYVLASAQIMLNWLDNKETSVTI